MRSRHAVAALSIALTLALSVSLVAPAAASASGLPTVPLPVISGTPAVGSTLTVDTRAWGATHQPATVQWSRNGSGIHAATGRSYLVTTADSGASITVSVSNIAGYTGLARTSEPVTIALLAQVAPVPVVTGIPRAGNSLTLTVGAWPAGPLRLSYQWLRDGTPVAGAISTTYPLTVDDAGALVTATVTGVRAHFADAVRTSTALLVLREFDSTPPPVIIGAPSVGAILSVSSAPWDPAATSATYRWMRDGATIAGATAATHPVVLADAGHDLTVEVRGSRAGYATAAQTSDPLAIERVLSPTPVPTITGVAAAGNQLVAHPGTWGPGVVDLTFQWNRAGVPIAGEVASAYSLTTDDSGLPVTVTVTGSRAGYTTVSRTSAPKAILGILGPTPDPTISGSGEVGTIITAFVGAWGPAPVTLHYQWLRNGTIAIGTAASYRVVRADWNNTITLRITATKSGYASEVRYSNGIVGQPPANPGDSVNCSNFSTWAGAWAWFITYFPYYGDIANLDGDNDGIPCESLPGHP